jgi:HprK-related kinase A
MEVRESRRSILRARRFTVFGDGHVMFKDCRAEEVLPYLEWGISWRLTECLPQFLQIHAAVLARSGQGIILAGISGAGKSTLAAGLLARRWRYLSDEFALIEPNTLRVHAFPKALCIKSGSFGVVEELGLPLWRRRTYFKARKGRVGYINPAETGAGVDSRPTPVRLVVFPRYLENVSPRLRPMSRAEAAFQLASCAFNRNTHGQQTLSILSRLLRRAECYRLDAGPIRETCRLLDSLVTSRPYAATA